MDFLTDIETAANPAPIAQSNFELLDPLLNITPGEDGKMSFSMLLDDNTTNERGFAIDAEIDQGTTDGYTVFDLQITRTGEGSGVRDFFKISADGIDQIRLQSSLTQFGAEDGPAPYALEVWSSVGTPGAIVGGLGFTGQDDDPGPANYGRLDCYVEDATNGDHRGRMRLQASRGAGFVYLDVAGLDESLRLVSDTLLGEVVQDKIWHNRTETTDGSATTIQSVPVADGYGATLKITINGRRTGGTSGSAGDSASYVKIGSFKRVAGTLTQLGTTTVAHSAEDQGGWDADFAISGGNVLVRVTGAADNTVLWTCKVEVLDWDNP